MHWFACLILYTELTFGYQFSACVDLQQRRLEEAQSEYDQEQEILKEEFDTERWVN